MDDKAVVVKVFVSRGRSVITGQPKTNNLKDTQHSHGPGETLMLDRDEAKRLIQLGAVSFIKPYVPNPDESNPANIGPQGGQVEWPLYERVYDLGPGFVQFEKP
jgi:hypothetical protein